jgi:hypothetical protein
MLPVVIIVVIIVIGAATTLIHTTHQRKTHTTHTLLSLHLLFTSSLPLTISCVCDFSFNLFCNPFSFCSFIPLHLFFRRKVYETNQLPSIEKSLVWGGDTFAAVAEALKAPIMRTQVRAVKLPHR